MKKSTTCAFILASTLASTLGLGAQAATYQVTEVEDGGNVTGRVTFTGDDPPPKVYAITKDTKICGSGDRLIDYVKVDDGGLADAVVYLAKIKAGKPFPETTNTGSVDQKGCEFHPFLQVMRNDQEFSALNSDPVSHNIHTYEILGRAKKTVFNVSQPDQGSEIKKKVKLKRGAAMKVECDQHDFMHGFVFVAKNPYFAVVDEKGNYTIDNIPPGKYTVKAWHGTLGEKKVKVDVGSGKSATADFEFKGK
uniref:Polysaccharide lyase family 4, domain II n=1 Tax=Candidatus Kentrum sp. LFY TaxID=2126342 RepID=A0A450UIP1_9GAMM|nr:MAG: Polysaccharide lyase family 4, domain II [Candidatus Kentron sp. LFY]